MQRLFAFAGAMAILVSVSGAEKAAAPQDAAATNAVKTQPAGTPLLVIHVDGQLLEPAWKEAGTQSDFVFPWARRTPPATRFRALVDAENLYFAFEATDKDIVVVTNFAGESTLDQEDRVEIFFARDAGLNRYYCLEIDPLGRVHDYAASYHRKFDSGWNCPGLRAAGTIRRGGYTVEASIPLETLADMVGRPVSAGTVLRIGLFRSEFRPGALGDADDNWLSWIRPEPRKPDFHVPSAFADWRVPQGVRTPAAAPPKGPGAVR